MALKRFKIEDFMKYSALVLLLITLVCCNNRSDIEKEIEEVEITVNLLRFDKDFAAANASNLSEVKAKYPVFFPKQFHDSIWLQKIADMLQTELDNEVIKKFPSEEKLESEIHQVFQHIKYYFPQFKSPTVFTTTSDVDYRNKVIVSDSIMVISLDTYLGSDHYFYADISNYITQNLKESQLQPDIARAYARQLISRPRQRSLLAQMIFFGKELYMKDLWLPDVSDAEKIGYTEDQYQWAQENEGDMWKYFVEKEMLYSTDPSLLPRFIMPAPFSKFYLEIDNSSPGMVGQYLGWQIVKSYMDRNDVSLDILLSKNAEDIFNESKYKPKRD